jgi:hypothetical protein
MSKRKNNDYDYEPEEEFLKNEKKTAARRSEKKKKRISYKMMDNHAEKIFRLQLSGTPQSDIATSLCIDLGVPTGTITAKNISGWLEYRKKSKTGAPRKVSLINDNLSANPDDDCMHTNLFKY